MIIFNKNMKNFSYSKTIKENWEVIVLITGLVMVVALSITLLIGFKYEANTKLLVVQKQNEYVNAYNANQSAIKVTEMLSQLVETSGFYTQVLNSVPEIKADFPKESKELKDTWKETVSTTYTKNLPILEINVYHADRQKAQILASAIVSNLIDKAPQYHGGGDNIAIKQVDLITASQYPIKPNMAVNAIASMIAGLFLGFAYVALKEQFGWFKSLTVEKLTPKTVNVPSVNFLADRSLEDSLIMQPEFVLAQEDEI